MLLLVEVAETSVDVDRDVKVPLFARAGVPEVWLVDLAGSESRFIGSPLPKATGMFGLAISLTEVFVEEFRSSAGSYPGGGRREARSANETRMNA